MSRASINWPAKVKSKITPVVPPPMKNLFGAAGLVVLLIFIYTVKNREGFFLMKNTIRRGVNRLGFDVIHLKRSPKRTLLGLAGHHIASIIDVGANKGQFARMISDFFPRAELYCFEPLDEPYRVNSQLGLRPKTDGFSVFSWRWGSRKGKRKCIYTSGTRPHPRCLRPQMLAISFTPKPRRSA